MSRQLLVIVFSVMVILTSASSSHAQMNTKVKRSVATMIFSSLGGAVLGLSTLSFYGKPEEHVNNITLGALLGFVGGASYVAYDSTRPQAAVYDYTQNVPTINVRTPILVQFNLDF